MTAAYQDNLIAQAYNRDPGREWERLVRDAYHSLEFVVTMHHLRRYLPRVGKVLDAGGGPGRYALELCRAGYEVALLDLSRELISVAQEKFAAESRTVRERLLESVVGDVRDLSRFETGAFDAILCLGPLTHLSDETDRQQAMIELIRTAKSGAIICIGVSGYLAALRTMLTKCPNEFGTASYRQMLKQGDSPVSGALWHFFRADELRQAAESCGLTTLEMVGCEGISTGLAEATNASRQNETTWHAWMDVLLDTSTDPAVVDMAEHIVYFGSK